MAAPSDPDSPVMAPDARGGPKARPAMRQGSLRNILLNAGWLLGGKGFGAVLSTVYLAIVTRSLGVEGFGRFALALGIGQTVAALATFQSWQVIVRYGMPHMHAHRAAELARLQRFGAWLDAASAVIGAGLVVAAFLLLGPRFGWTGEEQLQAMTLSVVIVLSVHSAPTGIMRLHDRFADATIAEATTPIVRFVGAVVVWLSGPSAVGFLLAWSMAEMLTALAYWYFALRLPGVTLRTAEPLRWRQIAGENPGIGRYAVITNLATSLVTGSKQVVVVLVGLVLTPAAAGGFRFAQQLSQALAKISQTLARAIFPELMRSHAATGSDREAFDRLFARTTRLAVMGGVVIVVILLVTGWPMLELIAGPAFLPYYPVLLVTGIAAALDFASVSFEPALTARGRAGTALRLRAVATIVMLAGFVLLARHFGVMGGAAAMLAGSALSFALFAWALRRPGREAPEAEAGARLDPFD